MTKDDFAINTDASGRRYVVNVKARLTKSTGVAQMMLMTVVAECIKNQASSFKKKKSNNKVHVHTCIINK